MSNGSEIFRKGDRFRGYVIEKTLGRGGNSAVFLVRHEVLDTHYAMKVMYPDVVAENDSFVTRFLREARLATRIRHPNLVSVHDCGHDAGRDLYYIVMDYVSGGSLREALAMEGRIPLPRAVDIVTQVAQALKAAADAQVVHRDIKPENILLQEDGRVKLVDLGIAKADDLVDSLHTSTDSIFGTPSYVSPEQAECSANVDTRADIYSLGIVFFEMLTGKCPYSGGNAPKILCEILSDVPTPDVRDRVPDIPENVAILVRRMTMKDRARRLASVDDLLTELGKLGVSRPAAAPAKPTAEYVSRPVPGMETLLKGLNVTTGDMPKAEPGAGGDVPANRPGKGLRILWLIGLLTLTVAVLCLVLTTR